MLTYEEISNLKKEVELFPNTAFYSMNDVNSIIVENTNTSALYIIPFEKSDKGIVFDCENAETIKEKSPTLEEDFVNNTANLKKNLKGLFQEEKYDESIENLKQLITDLPAVEPTSFIIAEKKEEIYKGILADKMNQYSEIEKEFKNKISLFDEDNDIVSSKVSATAYTKMEEELEEDMEDFEEAIQVYFKFKNSLTEIMEDEESRDALLENINMEKNLKISIPKNLVVIQNTINQDINVMETSKAIFESWDNILNEDGLNPALAVDKIFNFAQRDIDRPKFLKFKIGVFTVEDAMTLSEELDHAMSHIGSINDDELEFIANKKQILEYMIRTRKVSDRMMESIIKDFNSKFTNKANEDEYIQSQLGFKSREESQMGNIKGKANIEPEGVR